MVVVLDGLNECPEKSRKGLLQQLSALRLRLPMGIIITAQSAPALPEPMSGVEVRLVDPTADERLAILRSYGVEEVASLSEAFRTPFELAIAAECVSELSGNPTRADLLDAYVRRRTGSVSIRMALRCIAAVMDAQLRTSVPVADVMWALQRRPGDPCRWLSLTTRSPVLSSQCSTGGSPSPMRALLTSLVRRISLSALKMVWRLASVSRTRAMPTSVCTPLALSVTATDFGTR